MYRKLLFVLVLLTLLVSVAGAQDTYELTIMHTNDVHGHHEPQRNGDGGAARLATVVNQIRAEGGNSLLLDAGDRYTGTLFHVQHRGQDSVQIMNAIGYDALVLGNHEFNEGSENLAGVRPGAGLADDQRQYRLQRRPLSGGSGPAVGRPGCAGGESIGIIGLTTPETVILNLPSKDLVFHENLAEITQAQVDSLSAQGVNKIILLSHLGYSAGP